MRNRLADFDIDAFQHAEPGPHVGEKLLTRTLVQFERSLHFRNIHAERVFVQFGAPGFAGDRLYFGDFEQDTFHLAPDLIGLFERNAGHRRGIDRQRTFVERRQEIPSQAEKYDQRSDEQRDGRTDYEPFMRKHPFERLFVNSFQETGNDRFLLTALQHPIAGQQVTAQHRRQRHGDDHRREQRHDERNPERTQHASFEPAEEKQRHESHDRNDRRIDDRRTNLFRSLVDDRKRRKPFLFRFQKVLSESLEYVLDVDDRIVDQRADRNGHTAEAHRIDRKPHRLQRQHRHQQRQRQRDQRYDRRAEIHQEDEQHDHDENGPLEQRFLNVVHRTFNEPRLPENVGRNVHVRRQSPLDFGERPIEFVGQFERIGIRLFGHGHQNGRFAALRSDAQPRRFRSDFHIRNVFEQHRNAVRRLNDSFP